MSDRADDDLTSLRFEPERSGPGRRAANPGPRRRTPPGAGAERAGDFVEMLDDDAIEVGEDDLDRELAAGPTLVADDGGPPFRIDDDLFDLRDGADWGDQGGFWKAAAEELPGPAFAFSGEEPVGDDGSEAVIDRDEEVPERFWAPEVADFGRRSLALLVDQALLLAALAAFFLGALMALRLNGFDAGVLLAAAGLGASALPFTLLAAVLSLAYYGFFHGTTGRTPGKALVGIEVRAGNGGALTWGRVALRWLGAILGLACAGVGLGWALFDPRRRGWADLLSGTVIARARRQPAVEALRR